MSKRHSTSIYSRRTRYHSVSVVSPVHETSITFSPLSAHTATTSTGEQVCPQNLFVPTLLPPILPFHDDASTYRIKQLLWLRDHEKRFLEEGMDFARLIVIA